MLKICLIDDKPYGIPQLILSIPENIEYEFYYYYSIKDIESIDFDIVLLDFYLDKDGKTALDIIDRFKGSIVIGFSSENNKNDLILQQGGLYKAKKIKTAKINQELKIIFDKII